MFFKMIGPKILGVLLLQLQLILTPLSLIIFIQYFAVKYKVSCWTQQNKVFHWWPLKPDTATRFLCAFKHDYILNTYNSNSAISIDFIFCVRAGVIEIRVHQEPSTSFKQLLPSVKVLHFGKKWDPKFFCNLLTFRGASGLPKFDPGGKTCK